DTIDIDFDRHTVTVNGQILDEPYTAAPTSLSYDVEFPLTVEEGKVFVMGDNRNDSLDSRSSKIGQIDENYILGKAFIRFWPLHQWNIYENA
ncbi:MAG: signal peptidase I, partial [Clostridia bacterium]|nr:signal peptidase I [Clostridia bacterium]